MLKFIQLCLVACTCVLLTVSQQTCSPGWVKGNEACYILEDKDYFDRDPDHGWARATCISKYVAGTAAAIFSEDENNFLKSWLADTVDNSTEGVWIDGLDTYQRDDWQWPSQREGVAFSDWAIDPTTTVKRCMSMSPKYNFSWIPEDCDKKENMKFICMQSF